MKAKFLLLAALALSSLLGAGCRSVGPYERSFRAAPGVVAVLPAANQADPATTTNAVPLSYVSDAAWEIPDEPVISPNSIETAELAALSDVTNWIAVGWAEIGRSEFISRRLASDRSEAVSFAARIGAPAVLFATEDLGSQWVWRTEYEPRHVWVVPPPPPPRGPYGHRPPPPPPVLHTEMVPVERLRLVRHYRHTAIYLGSR